jgi:ribosomal protein L9
MCKNGNFTLLFIYVFAVYVTDANLLKHGYVNKAAVAKSAEIQAKENEDKLKAFLKNPIVFSRAATTGGALFGSVSSNDVKHFVTDRLGHQDATFPIDAEIDQVIKSVGEHSVRINKLPATVVVTAI